MRVCGDCKCNSQEESQSLESRKESDTGGKRPVPPTRGLTFSMTINVFYDEPIIYLHITVPFMNFGWTRIWIKLSTRWKDTQYDQKKKKTILKPPKRSKNEIW